MARSLWKGAISFGLVSVPVELHSAKRRAAELDMTMLDKRDLSPVGYKRVNKSNGKEVPWGEVVKGYEYKDERYVVMSVEDFRRANPEAAKFYTPELEARSATAPANLATQFVVKPDWYIDNHAEAAKRYLEVISG